MSGYSDVNFVAGAFWAGNPDTALTWLRANDPVHLHEPTGMWGITKYDDIRRVETDQETFTATRGILPGDTGVPMMATMDDPAHMARRRLMSTGFTPKRVQNQAPRIRAVCDQLIDNVIEDGRCDFVWDIAAWLPLTLIGDLLGFESADHPKLLEWSDDMLMGLGTDDPASGREANGVRGRLHGLSPRRHRGPPEARPGRPDFDPRQRRGRRRTPRRRRAGGRGRSAADRR